MGHHDTRIYGEYYGKLYTTLECIFTKKVTKERELLRKAFIVIITASYEKRQLLRIHVITGTSAVRARRIMDYLTHKIPGISNTRMFQSRSYAGCSKKLQPKNDCARSTGGGPPGGDIKSPALTSTLKPHEIPSAARR